jgi:hypothetical protein
MTFCIAEFLKNILGWCLFFSVPNPWIRTLDYELFMTSKSDQVPDPH